MKFNFLFLLFLLCTQLNAQPGVSVHLSTLSFLGVNYEFKDIIRPELRLGTENDLETFFPELVCTYDFINNEEYEIYAGAGIFIGSRNTYLGIPIGINFYPIEDKKIGFHLELPPLIESDTYLRPSEGVRYRFLDFNK